ncbi:MAG: TlpA family protein disulfide reductase [Saprospiraceae bacterium]|nr:TlpA family protein disulfide reductase [Saprospiraceae bacterium]
MKSLKIALIFAFITLNVIGQDIDLKSIRKSFTTKYSNSNNTSISYLYSYYIFGQDSITDTISVILSHKKKIKFRNQVQLKIDNFNLLFDGDSIYRKYDSGETLENLSFTKGNVNYLKQYLNPNPFYNSILFFWYLPKCDIKSVQEIDNKTILNLRFTEKKYFGKRIANYTLNLTDTVIEKYYVDYISDNIDFTTKYEYYDYIYFSTDSANKTNFFKNIETPEAQDLDTLDTKKPKPDKRGSLKQDSYFKDYKCMNLNGDSISIKSFKAKYYLIDLWYIGCKPCANALPYINEIQKDFTELKVIGINVLNENLQDVKVYKQKKNLSYDILLMPGFMNEIYTGYPTFLILDSELKILYMQRGFSEKYIKEMRNYLETLDFN